MKQDDLAKGAKDVMKLNEVQKMAKKHGITSFGKTKANLIREIQLEEGNFDCFGTAIGYCDQVTCCFRSTCLNNNKVKASASIISLK